MALHPFEKNWQKRFVHFSQGVTDAAVAGWSHSGLEARLGFFNHFFNSAPGGLWLDAGCGAGTYCELLSKRGFDIIGLDYSFQSLQRARTKSGKWLGGSALQLPFAARSFEGILCFGVSQAVQSQYLLVKELHSALKPKGVIWIDGLNQWSFSNSYKTLKLRIKGKRSHLNYTSPWSMKKCFKDLGYDVELFYAPILPGAWAKWNSVLLGPFMQKLYQVLPFSAIWFSHAYYIKAVKQSEEKLCRASRI